MLLFHASRTFFGDGPIIGLSLNSLQVSTMGPIQRFVVNQQTAVFSDDFIAAIYLKEVGDCTKEGATPHCQVDTPSPGGVTQVSIFLVERCANPLNRMNT
ncbi:hypothetical protein RF11_13478 [Thelohanellus kitauei]|uniref:Uncharacterized protein n=1 Tax=Thelohanellus kitauei TaxID=669202 RepID=A0A0C2MU51_THEKT|nr:hypothetical protein RF11_13478 [Thelohanellus kitauei]